MDDVQIVLARYRISKAYECIKESQLMYENEMLSGSVNRSYYAIFNAARSVLALDGIDRSKHSGVIAYFQKEYIKTGIFARDLSDIIQDAFHIRQITDYQDYYVVSKDEVKSQLENAKQFCDEMKEYLENRISENG